MLVTFVVQQRSTGDAIFLQGMSELHHGPARLAQSATDCNVTKKQQLTRNMHGAHLAGLDASMKPIAFCTETACLVLATAALKSLLSW